MAELTIETLAAEIETNRQALKAGEHLQVCLWLAGDSDLEELEYLPEVVPVVSADFTIHESGGGIARGGDHIDFAVEHGEPKSSEELAKAFLGAAEQWAAENLCSPQSSNG